MKKNLIEIIAQELGVEIGEEFGLTWKVQRPWRYKFDKARGLLITKDYKNWERANLAMLDKLILGEVRLEKRSEQK